MTVEEKGDLYKVLCDDAGVIKRRYKPTFEDLGRANLINVVNAAFYDVNKPITTEKELWDIAYKAGKAIYGANIEAGKRSAVYQYHGLRNLYHRSVDLWNYTERVKEILRLEVDRYIKITELMTRLLNNSDNKAVLLVNLNYSLDLMHDITCDFAMLSTLNSIYGAYLIFIGLGKAYSLPEMKELASYSFIKERLENEATDASNTLHIVMEPIIIQLDDMKYKDRFNSHPTCFFFEIPMMAYNRIEEIEEEIRREEDTFFKSDELKDIIESLSNYEIVANNPITSLSEIAGYGGYSAFLETQPKG